jgi:hypothetical protein
MDLDYFNRNYKVTVIEGVDRLTLSKHPAGFWSEIEMRINENPPARITLRSKEMAEQLHHMLGQMLK